MKLKNHVKQYRTVKYFGIDLTVPVVANYIATDRNGNVHSFRYEPTARCGGYWRNEDEVDDAYVKFIAIVDLEKLDWRNSLVTRLNITYFED